MDRSAESFARRPRRVSPGRRLKNAIMSFCAFAQWDALVPSAHKRTTWVVTLPSKSCDFADCRILQQAARWTVALCCSALVWATCAHSALAGTLVNLNFTNFGTVQVDLFDELAPLSVANFMQYANNHTYDDTMIHRVDTTNGVIQGGGYQPNGAPITTYGTVNNESWLNNTRGTIGLARQSDVNSAQGQWFINTQDNSSNFGAGWTGVYSFWLGGRGRDERRGQHCRGADFPIPRAIRPNPAPGFYAARQRQQCRPHTTRCYSSQPARAIRIRSTKSIRVSPRSIFPSRSNARRILTARRNTSARQKRATNPRSIIWPRITPASASCFSILCRSSSHPGGSATRRISASPWSNCLLTSATRAIRN